MSRLLRVAALAILLPCTPALLLPGASAAQSTLERTPNLSGTWVGSANVVSFNVVHRFNHSGAPERQVQNRPTFLLGYGMPFSALVGVSYTTRSALAAAVPNEWQPFARLRRDIASVAVGGEAAYNTAARSVDAELSVTRRFGALTPILAARVLSRDGGSDRTAFVLASGMALRLHEHAALAADAALRPGSADDDVAWGAALQLRIPHTPHTISLHAANTDAATLQSASRATGTIRWGFEFTVPFTLARYFGGGSERAVLPNGDTASAADSTIVVMEALQFTPARLEVRAGTRVVWRNRDPLEHSVTAADTSWDSGGIAPGASWSRVFGTRGTFEIFCTPHPFMRMRVVVVE